jgi:acyl carrier protein
METKMRESASGIREGFVGFIISNYLFGDRDKLPRDEESLIDLGIVDSTGILELIEFTEEHFNVTVGDTETVPENLGSIANLVRFVSEKQA